MQLKIEHLTKKIGKATVLQDISMELHGGRVYGLAGKNGCGKTMLMRCMCGLIKPTEGSVTLDGEQLWRDISFPRSVGMLIETPAFLPGMTGRNNLKLLAGVQKRVGDDRVCEVLDEVGLDPHDKRKYYKYSLGMKQRLGVAAALMENPELIILDEPINALDVSAVERIRVLIDRHKQRGALIVVACHDKEELELLADDIYRLEDGRVTGCDQVSHNEREEDTP